MRAAADTSSLIAYFARHVEKDTEMIASCLMHGELYLPPVVLTEMLSAPRADVIAPLLEALPLLSPDAGFWKRAAKTRSSLLARHLKAHIADTYICQSCLDADVALITRDGDFRHYAKWAGLKLAVK